MIRKEGDMSRKITVEGLFVSDEEGARIVLEGKEWPWFTLDDLIGTEHRDHPVRVEIEISVTRLDMKPGEKT